MVSTTLLSTVSITHILIFLLSLSIALCLSDSSYLNLYLSLSLSLSYSRTHTYTLSPTDMSRPKIGIFAKHIIPQTRFSFTLHRRDVRLLWAINCGSYSLLPVVPVYVPELLDQQLDAIMR